MTQPFVGEIRPFAFTFAPRNWATCDGQLIAISQNTALFSLLGTNYGGNGTSTFQLPNLQDRVPLHSGGQQGPGLSDYVVGDQAGSATVTLTTDEMPVHTHSLISGVSSPIDQVQQTNIPSATALISTSGPGQAFSTNETPAVAMSPLAIGTYQGGSQPHQNQQPYLAVLFCISLRGVFPTRN